MTRALAQELTTCAGAVTCCWLVDLFQQWEPEFTLWVVLITIALWSLRILLMLASREKTRLKLRWALRGKLKNLFRVQNWMFIPLVPLAAFNPGLNTCTDNCSWFNWKFWFFCLRCIIEERGKFEVWTRSSNGPRSIADCGVSSGRT